MKNKITGHKKAKQEASAIRDPKSGELIVSKERIKEVILFMKSSKPKTSSNQFEMTSALIIKDKVNKGEVTIDSKNLKTLIEAFKRYKNLASDKDFN